tara:strand:+ start:434 stop:580 length:147 start_codon:yes stop_codon:yes gene_type:complete
MKDDLNLYRWRMLLIKVALKRYSTKMEAAKALGISKRTLEIYAKKKLI